MLTARGRRGGGAWPSLGSEQRQCQLEGQGNSSLVAPIIGCLPCQPQAIIHPSLHSTTMLCRRNGGIKAVRFGDVRKALGLQADNWQAYSVCCFMAGTDTVVSYSRDGNVRDEHAEHESWPALPRAFGCCHTL